MLNEEFFFLLPIFFKKKTNIFDEGIRILLDSNVAQSNQFFGVIQIPSLDRLFEQAAFLERFAKRPTPIDRCGEHRTVVLELVLASIFVF